MDDVSSKTMQMKQVSTGSNPKRVAVKPSQIGWGMKRHRTAGVNSEMNGGLDEAEERISTGNPNKAETTTGGPPLKAWSSDLEKSGVGLLGHRFADATVIVPIKKRKIHVEVLRSPSPPPPRSPSPCVETLNINENGNGSDMLHPTEDPELMDGECPQVKGDGETTSSSRDFLLAEEEKVCNILAELKEVHDVATSLDPSKVTAQLTEDAKQDGVDGPDNNDHDQSEVELSNEGKLEGSEVESSGNDEPNLTNERSLHDCLENNSYTNNRSEHEVAMDCVAEEGRSSKCGGWIEWDNDELEEAEEHVDYGEEDVLEYDEIIEGVNMHPRQDLGDSDADITPKSFDVLEEAENSIEGKESDAVIEATNGLEEDLLDKQSWELVNRSLEHGSGMKPSGWDQLPKGFDSVEDALRAAKENSERHISRGLPRGTTIRRGSVGGRLSWGMTSPAMAWESHGSRRMEEDASTRYASRDVEPARQLGRGGGSAGLLLPGRARFDSWNKGLGNSASHWGPNRHRHSPSRYGGHASFGKRGERESFVLGIDRMSLARRGGLRSVIGSSHGGGQGMTIKGPSTGIDFSGRIGVGPNKGIDARTMMRGVGYGSSDSYRGRSFRGSGMDSALHRTYLGDQRLGLLRRERSLSPRRNRDSPQHSKPYTSRKSVGIGSISGMQIERGRTQAAPSPKSMSILSSRSRRSPLKWSTERREGGYIQSDRDFKRSSARRTSPHVVHGSSLTDERDRQVLAGAWNDSPKHKQIESITCGRLGSVGKSTDGSLGTRRGKQEEDDSFREAGISRSSSRDRGRVVSVSLRRDSGRDDDERWREKPGRGNRHANGPKQGGGGTWDGDDDVAPRRRRPP